MTKPFLGILAWFLGRKVCILVTVVVIMQSDLKKPHTFKYFFLQQRTYQCEDCHCQILRQGSRLSRTCIYTVNVYRGLRGVHRFSLQYLWKRAIRITKKPYTLQRERYGMLWRNPVIFTDCGGNPIVIIGFLCDSYSLFP